MAEQPDATFKIPREIIQPIVEAKVASAMIEALGNQQWLVTHCIKTVLDQKVNDQGAKCESYYADKSPTFLQWALEACVKAAVKKAIQDEVEKHKDSLREALQKELQKKNSPIIKQLLDGMVKGVIDATTHPYRLTVEVKREN